MVDFSLATNKVEKEYPLTCEIQSKIVWYDDIDSKNIKSRQSSEMFFLVPKTSTSQIMFFDAWLPSCEEEVYEMASIIEHPVGKPCRIGLRLRNKDCNQHHLILMSPDVEDSIRKYVDYIRQNNKTDKYPELKLTIMPSSMEAEFNI